jgi:hypothetical protein
MGITLTLGSHVCTDGRTDGQIYTLRDTVSRPGVIAEYLVGDLFQA